MDEKSTIQFIQNHLLSKSVISDVLTITPKVAEYMLNNMKWPENRNLSDVTVTKYANAIRHGHWRLNGEPVIVSNSGALIDGQHRLWAVHNAGKSIDAVVTFGVDHGVTSTINCGRARSMAFLASMSNSKAAALNFIIRLMYGSSESTASNLLTMDQLYGESIQTLIKKQSGGKCIPILRQAPVTAAAAIWMVAGETEYVSDMYDSLIDLDSGSLPPIGKAFLHQCAEASMGAKHKPTGNDLFTRAFKTFDPKQGLVRKLVIKDSSIYVDQARGMVTKAMKHGGITLDAKPVETKRPAKKTKSKGK